jgi:hypothetical protein
MNQEDIFNELEHKQAEIKAAHHEKASVCRACSQSMFRAVNSFPEEEELLSLHLEIAHQESRLQLSKHDAQKNIQDLQERVKTTNMQIMQRLFNSDFECLISSAQEPVMYCTKFSKKSTPLEK